MNQKPFTIAFRLGGRTRRYSVPAHRVRRALVGAGLAGASLAAAAVFLAVDSGARARAGLLARENRLLQAEMEAVRASVADLDGEMAALVERDRRLRTLAGLSGLDEEILEVGIGGPGLDKPEESELWQLDPEASETAYAFRYDLAMLLRKTDLLNESFFETEETLADRRDRVAAMPAILPTRGVVGSRFSTSRFNPVHKMDLPHFGVDQNAATGTPFVATADGVVTFAGWKPGYGRTVQIDHGFGIATLYAHASKLLVHAGKRVDREDVIGLVGCSGACTGPHVHYEVRVNGRPVDPMNYVLRGSKR